MSDVLVDNIKSYFSNFEGAEEFFNILAKSGEVFCCGGMLRQFKETGSISNLRDADFTILFQDAKLWNEYIKDKDNYRYNRFDGMKFNFGGLIIDVWDIKKTWGIYMGYVKVKNENYLEALANSVYLNIESIFYNIQKQEWADELYYNALEKKILNIVLRESPYKDFEILKAIKMKRKYDLNYSTELGKLILRRTKNCRDYPKLLYDIQEEKHYIDILSKEEIQAELKEISYNPYFKEHRPY